MASGRSAYITTVQIEDFNSGTKLGQRVQRDIINFFTACGEGEERESGKTLLL
jgi:hypothetical protein